MGYHRRGCHKKTGPTGQKVPAPRIGFDEGGGAVYQVRFLEGESETAVTRQSQPEFYRLYQQSVLLCLQEQGVLDEAQAQWCLERLEQQWEN